MSTRFIKRAVWPALFGCFAVAWSAVAAPLAAASAAQTNPSGGDAITMNMRDADVRSVIQWMAETSGRNFIVDPSVSGKVTVLSSEPLAPEQAFEVFMQALDLNGLSAVVDGNIVTVAPAAKLANTRSNVLDSFTETSSSEKAVHIFNTESVDAERLVNELQPLIGEHGKLAYLGASNSILIADRVDNIKRVRGLIRRMDANGKMNIDVHRLQHVDADATLASLQQLGSQRLTSNGPTFASDARSNSILVSGTPQQRRQAKDLLRKLDNPGIEQGSTEVVYVHYMNASELVPILQGLHAQNESSVKTAHVNIQASESTNALVLTAPDPILSEMKTVIAEIDVQRRQVLLEAVIVEVSDQLVQDLGVQWNTAFDGEGVETATDFGLNQVERIADTAGNVVSEQSVLGRGFTLGYYRKGDLRALMQALEQTTDANLLSTPSIVALNNEEAEILVGSNVPIRTGEQNSQANSVANPFSTIERRDIGVSLKVTPQINQQDSIMLDILQQVENISNSDLVDDLVFDKRSIKTRVMIDNNEVLVLGGLTRQDNREVIDRVPVLGYIPILGKLFQRSSEQTVRNNLMVFIHPRILDKREQRTEISRKNYQNVREQQAGHRSKPPQRSSPLLQDFDLKQGVVETQ